MGSTATEDHTRGHSSQIKQVTEITILLDDKKIGIAFPDQISLDFCSVVTEARILHEEHEGMDPSCLASMVHIDV